MRDYFDHDTFNVCYCQSARDAPRNLATFELSGLRVAKKGVSKVRLTLKIEKDLSGSFAVEDVLTESRKLVMFDAKPELREADRYDIITGSK